MVTSWRTQRKEHLRAMVLSERYRQWMAFVVRLEPSYYAHWAMSLADQPVSPQYNPLKPWEWLMSNLPPEPEPEPEPPEPPSFDSDALDFFTRANITDAVQQNAVNDLVLALKAANIWTRMRALYPFVGGTAVSHSVNLKDSNYSITWYGTISHDATGILGASLSFADTFLNVNTTVLGSIAYGCYQRNSEPDNNRSIAAQGPVEYAIYTNFSGTFYGVAGSAGQVAYANPDGKGFYVVSRQSTSLWKAYKNGTQIGTTQTDPPSALPDASFKILLAGNLNNLAFAFISDGLLDAEVVALNTAVATYQTALGRNV